MGGVDDETEPATKRMKLSSGLLSNGSSRTKSSLSAPIDLMARPLPSSGDEETVGSSGLIKRVELVRVITKALYSLGYESTAALLEDESGIPLHSALVNRFMQQFRDGDWDESVSTLRKINHMDENALKNASFFILEQKFFEFIDRDRVTDALKTLRSEITPLGINTARIRELSSYMLSLEASNQMAKRTKCREKLLDELQKFFPPMVMIPESRLEHLVEQALVSQRDTCLFHNSLENEMSLYKDHHCGKDQLPSRTLQVLQEHTDEVWFLKFSHNGKYLASASTDKTAIIWEVDSQGVTLKHKLSGHLRSVSSVSWSPDDRQLLTCGIEESVRRWDVSTGECLQVYEKSGSLSFVSCGWFPDGTSLCFGLTDKTLLVWDMDEKELDSFKGQRTLKISDLEITSDGKHVISSCRESAILLLSVESRVERLIEEDQEITSFSLSRDNKHLLVNLLNEEIHLWNIEGDVKLVAKFKGHKRARFVIRSCFGGIGEGFIASGSEDSQVYIWHRASGKLIEPLPGHSGCVNCVAWNPTNPHMLASASDDRTIRIWGINDLKKKKKKHNGSSSQCNGVHYCNGTT